jgi:hypothetical protein
MTESLAESESRQFDWEANTNGVTPADVDSNYQAIIERALNGAFATHGPVVLNHELSTYASSRLYGSRLTVRQLHHVRVHEIRSRNQVGFPGSGSERDGTQHLPPIRRQRRDILDLCAEHIQVDGSDKHYG